MSLCAMCGAEAGDASICAYHVHGEDFAGSNRVMCDFFHRHREPARVEPSERDAPYAEAAQAPVPVDGDVVIVP